MPEFTLLRPTGAQDAKELARLVRDGLVQQVVADIHVVTGLPADRAVRIAAVRQLLPARMVAAGAAVSGPDAVWLYAGGPAPDRLHVTLPSGRGRPGSGHLVAHEARLRDDDVDLLDGVPVTVPDRTAADVARLLAPELALPLLDRLAAAVPVDPRDALVHLERLSGCRGVEVARRTVLAWRDGRRASGNLTPGASPNSSPG
jgi:hypothetical protein